MGEANEILVAHSASCGYGATHPRERGEIKYGRSDGPFELCRSLGELGFLIGDMDPQLALWATDIPPANAGFCKHPKPSISAFPKVMRCPLRGFAPLVPSRHMLIDREMGQKSAHCIGVKFPRVTLVMKQDVSLDPVTVSIFGTK